MTDIPVQTNENDHRPDSLLIKLRASTRDQHNRLHDVVGSLSMFESLKHYSVALQRYLFAVNAVESAAKVYLVGDQQTDTASLDWDSRLLKAGWIESDLKNLGAPVAPALPADDAKLEITTEAELIGATYVVEGMTLGGQQMLRALHGHFGENAIGATSFFASYGDQIGAMWTAWKAWAMQQQVSADESVAAAVQTFELFETALADRDLGEVTSQTVVDGTTN